jgi:hypothetical protein
MLLTIDLLFPNLEKLDSQTESNFLYSFFCETLTENNKFSSLRTIPNPKNKNQEELYLKCLEYVKNRITSIEITNNYDNKDDNDNDNDDDDDDDRESFFRVLLGKLNEYPKLKKIVIYSPNEHINFSDYDYTEYFEDDLLKEEN